MLQDFSHEVAFIMKTVLIVDDSDNMRMTIKALVEANGYTVVGEAGDGRTGIELYQQLKPDIVTMDVVMHDMDGIEALKNIMLHDPNANVVMVSAMGQSLFVRDAIVAGAKGFIVKPFGEQQIVETFSKVFRDL